MTGRIIRENRDEEQDLASRQSEIASQAARFGSSKVIPPYYPRDLPAGDPMSPSGVSVAEEELDDGIQEALSPAKGVLQPPGDYIAYDSGIGIFGYRAIPIENAVYYGRVTLPEGIVLRQLGVYLAGAAVAPGTSVWMGLYRQQNPLEKDWRIPDGQPRFLIAETGVFNVQAPDGEKMSNLIQPYAVTADSIFWYAVKASWGAGNTPWWWSSLSFYGGDMYPLYGEVHAPAGLPAVATPVQAPSSTPLVYMVGRV